MISIYKKVRDTKGRIIGVRAEYKFVVVSDGGGRREYSALKTYLWEGKNNRCSTTMTNLPSGQKLPAKVRDAIRDDEDYAKKKTLPEFRNRLENMQASKSKGCCGSCIKAAKEQLAAAEKTYWLVIARCGDLKKVQCAMCAQTSL